jgi:hypothetical protein
MKEFSGYAFSSFEVSGTLEEALYCTGTWLVCAKLKGNYLFSFSQKGDPKYPFATYSGSVPEKAQSFAFAAQFLLRRLDQYLSNEMSHRLS